MTFRLGIRMKKEVKKYAWINGFIASGYIVLIALLMNFLGKIFPTGSANPIIAQIFLLLLFVFSAALTGILVFGRPIMWYIDGKKKDAVFLLIQTAGIIFVVTLIAFILLIWLV